MIVVKTSNWLGPQNTDVESYLGALEDDQTRIVTALQGRVRFGNGTSGGFGENLNGQFLSYTSNAIPDTEDTINHDLAVIPVGYLVLYQDIAGISYQGPTTGTNWTNTQIFLKCDTASVTFLLFLLR